MVIGLIVVLYVLAAALPFWGLYGIFRTAREDAAVRERLIAERGFDHVTFDDVDRLTVEQWENPVRVLEHARGDLRRIGIGLLCGAAASIWSLFV